MRRKRFMTCYFIDPYLEAVQVCGWRGEEHEILAALARSETPPGEIESLRLRTGDRMAFTNDAGREEGVPVFELDGYPAPFCGYAMVVGQRGEHAAVAYVDLISIITFPGLVTTGELGPGSFTKANVYQEGAPILRRGV